MYYGYTFAKPHIHNIVLKWLARFCGETFDLNKFNCILLKSLAVCVARHLTDKTLYNAVNVWFGKCLAIIHN